MLVKHSLSLSRILGFFWKLSPIMIPTHHPIRLRVKLSKEMLKLSLNINVTILENQGIIPH